MASCLPPSYVWKQSSLWSAGGPAVLRKARPGPPRQEAPQLHWSTVPRGLPRSTRSSLNLLASCDSPSGHTPLSPGSPCTGDKAPASQRCLTSHSPKGYVTFFEVMSLVFTQIHTLGTEDPQQVTRPVTAFMRLSVLCRLAIALPPTASVHPAESGLGLTVHHLGKGLSPE